MTNWTDADAIPLREYLASPSGQNFLKAINEQKPEAEGVTFEETALNAKMGLGWDKLIKLITDLAEFKAQHKVPTQFVPVDQ